MNKVLLVGRLVRDPELQETTSGIKYTRFTIAVDNPFSKDQSADYVPCIAWRNRSNFVSNYLNKGDLISLEGRFSSSNYQNNEGKTIYVYEVTTENIQGLESLEIKANRQKVELKNQPNISIDKNEIQNESSNPKKEEKEEKEEELNNDVPWELDL